MSIASLDKALQKTTDRSVGDIISEFGGDKVKIGMAAQAGKIDPTKAVMAAMAVDRIVLSNSKPPQATVAQEVLGPAMQQAQQQRGIGQIPTRPQMAQGAPARPQGQGLNQVPVPPKMFDSKKMAGGGIVAFAAGDLVQAPSSLQDVLKLLSYQELEDYSRTGRLPEKYRMMVPGAEPSFVSSVQKQQAAVPTTPMSTFAPFESAVPDLGQGATRPPVSKPKLSPEQALRAELESTDIKARKPRPDPNIPTMLAPDLDKQEAAPEEDYTDYEDVEGSPSETKTGLSSFSDYIDEARRLLPQQDPEESNEDYVKRMYSAVGANKNVFAEQAKRIANKRQSADLDRKQAANLRIIEAGLGILGGTSPHAFVNIGKGATPALQGFVSDIREIQKRQDALDEAEARLKVAEYSDKKADARTIMELDQQAKKAKAEREASVMSLAVNMNKIDLQKVGITSQENLTKATMSQTNELRRLGIGATLARNEDTAIKNAALPFDKQIEAIEKMAQMQGGKLKPEQEQRLAQLRAERKRAVDAAAAKYNRLQRNVSGTSEFEIVR